MAGLKIPGVKPEPLPAIIDNQIQEDEDGNIWIVHMIANTGGVAMAWIPLDQANSLLNDLASSIQEAHRLSKKSKLVVAHTMPKGNGHAQG